MRKTIPGAAALAVLALTTAAGCTSSGSTGTATPAASTPAASAPAETPLPAAGSWTTPQFPSANAAAKAADCELVKPAGIEPPVSASVRCTTPVPDDGGLEIFITTYTTPAAEQAAVDQMTAGAQDSGDFYLVQGRGVLTECIEGEAECRYVQARIGGGFSTLSPH